MVILLIGMTLGIVSCTKISTISENTPPTSAFYINDFAGAFLRSTEWYILNLSEGLYEDSLSAEWIDDNIRGSQIVVTTIQGEKGSVNTSKMFNEWGIGQNNMGFMIVLYFSFDGEFNQFEDYEFIWGRQMETFATIVPSELVGLWDDTFNDPAWFGDYEAGFMSFYYEFLARIYVDIYDYSSFNYDMQDYLDDQFDDFPPIDADAPTYDIDLWVIFVIIGVLILLGLGSRTLFPIILMFLGGRSNRGGGGGTGGYRI